MPQSFGRIILHVVWSTKRREPVIANAITSSLYAYIGGTLRELDSVLLAAGGTSDHLHLLCECSRNHGAAQMVKQMKVSSSLWMKTQSATLSDFHWQTGYAAFSVSLSNISRVTKYIDSQQEHHKRLSFQDEFRALLRKHAIAFDEQYVWD